MITEETVRHIAKLARLSLKDEEVGKFAKQLNNVLNYMEILSEVDTSDVPETSQVTGLQNVMCKDEIGPSQSAPEELLALSELPIDSGQIRVQKAIDN